MDRRGFLQSILSAGIAPAFVGASILMPVKVIAAPEHRPLILPDSGELYVPGSVSVLSCVKQPMGHRLHLSTPRGTMYVDAVLPAAWWMGEGKLKFQEAYAERLYNERHLRLSAKDYDGRQVQKRAQAERSTLLERETTAKPTLEGVKVTSYTGKGIPDHIKRLWGV